MPETIRLPPVEAGVATIVLSRPEKKNALSIALRDEVSDAIDALVRDEAVKALVITGAGNVFSAGFDLAEFRQLGDPDHARRLWDSSDRFHSALLRCPLPTIAAVNGPALAGGFDLAVLCDVRIASTTAVFAHPEVTFGDVVYGPLHDLVGGAVARELVLTGRSLDAMEALALRLVSAIAAPDDLAAEVGRWAAQVTRAPRELLLRTKQKIIRRAGEHPRATLDL
jgi:enoyl-CoA hydratase/carnithine racemase